MADFANKMLVSVLSKIARNDEERRKSVEAEVTAKGTHWAIGEIAALRETVARLERRLEALGKSDA